jgi:hypothetical protein
MSGPLIHVGGDGYSAVFYIRDGTVKDVSGDCAIAMPVGATYICQAIRFMLSRRGRQKGAVVPEVKQLGPQEPFRSETKVRALYTISNVGEVSAFEEPLRKQPVLRSTTETKRLEMTGVELPPNVSSDDRERQSNTPSQPETGMAEDVVVHWLGELVKQSERGPKPAPPFLSCKIHIQIGLFGKLSRKVKMAGSDSWRPEVLANPSVGRIVVVNVGEISDEHRVRKSQSYEAIAVDLLRYLRGDSETPEPESEGVLQQLSMYGVKDKRWSILAVRLNNSAVFLYICGWWNPAGSTPGSGETESLSFQEQAWIVCHKQQCAPMETPELGRMLGFTGFVSASFAGVAFEMAGLGIKDLGKQAVASVKRSLAWQRAAYERGCLTMLFELKPREIRKPKKKVWSAAPDYGRLLKEVYTEVREVGRRSGKPGKTAEDEVIAIQVDISRAVAHRTPWFMARSSVFPANRKSPSNKLVEARFRELALGWLSDVGGSGVREPEDDDVPIVSIGDLKLTDRREVEDFLAIHQALDVYSKSAEAKPLNVAVFGAPGAGKSFGVKQVVNYIGRTAKDVFQEAHLEFNLGQFKTLNDLPAALHLVRNECLSGKIPIVFFDEFDSAFDGQAFGWLKYLLAPMQDGSFYDNGATYKIGKAVFILAGGVNRSFEELNGRMRNPGFCEAKGPDFISRLKVHLNLQGVNKPEDEGDQGRYVLRRGILLHGIVRRRLELKSQQKRIELLHPSVAHALLSLERFKHGVRSLESIIKMCTVRSGHPIGPSDLPSLEQMEMHVDASKLLKLVDDWKPM